MRLLAGTHYDPAVAVTKTTATASVLAAFDTSNLRLTFTAPSTGNVLVRSRVPITGATTSAMVLFGVLDGATVKCRQPPVVGRGGAASAAIQSGACSMVVTGLTPGTSYSWDLAWATEFPVASSVLKYGGPDVGTASTAAGGVAYEIWDAPGLLSSIAYDPASAAVSSSVAAAAAVAALDTTNLRTSFVAPSSGNVVVRLRGVVSGTTGTGQSHMWAVLDGATVRFRQRGVGGFSTSSTLAATDHITTEATGLVTGLTGGTTYTWDAAFAAQSAESSAVIKYGGPNDTTQDNAWGQFTFDVWSADDLPRAIGGVA